METVKNTCILQYASFLVLHIGICGMSHWTKAYVPTNFILIP